MLKGKKTYFVAASTILGAVAAVLGGTMTLPEAIQLSITAIFAATLRDGINSK